MSVEPAAPDFNAELALIEWAQIIQMTVAGGMEDVREAGRSFLEDLTGGELAAMVAAAPTLLLTMAGMIAMDNHATIEEVLRGFRRVIEEHDGKVGAMRLAASYVEYQRSHDTPEENT